MRIAKELMPHTRENKIKRLKKHLKRRGKVKDGKATYPMQGCKTARKALSKLNG